jgi:uncharacterized protein (TIGR03437 family)
VSRLIQDLLVRCGTAVASVALLSAQPAVLTWHNDNARTGQNLQETILTPATVNAAVFGRLATISVDGKVDAQPLYVASLTIPGQGLHNVLYIATEHDSVYAFDADTFSQLLHVSLAGAGETPSDDRGCSQVTPEIGITATPAIDLKAGPHGTMYVIAMSKTTAGEYHHRLHALDLTTLGEQFSGPVEIEATFPGAGIENTFIPAQHVERPGLLILNGAVYTSWGSHCDAEPYAGWVLSYDEMTLAQTGVLNLEPNGQEGGIWAAGSGPAADANGNIYLLTGNGTFDAALNSSNFPARGDFGNAFVKIATSGPPSVTDYFTMTNTVAESAGDVDLGSGGLLLLPPLSDAQGQAVSLAAGAGKDGNIYIVNQNGMGKFDPGMDSIYQLISKALPGGAWSSPAWFNGTLYYAGVGDSLKAFKFSSGSFSLASHSSNTFTYPGATPSISANGTLNGIVWTADNQNPAILHAYDATDVSVELYNSNQATSQRDQFGAGNKFIVPTIANGKVYVGTTSGVGVFGLLAPAGAPPLLSGVVNAASGSAAAPQVVVPGGYISIYGSNMASNGNPFASSVPLPTMLNGAQVTIGGETLALSYASAGQVNGIVPFDLKPNMSFQLVVIRDSTMSAPVTVTTTELQPAIFTQTASGSGQGAILINGTGLLAGPVGNGSRPAIRGMDYLQIFCTGLGPVSGPDGQAAPPTGSLAPLSPLLWTNAMLTVTIGGVAARVLYAGLAPDEANLYQVNVLVPEGAAAGDNIPVVITGVNPADGFTAQSNTVTVSLQ